MKQTIERRIRTFTLLLAAALFGLRAAAGQPEKPFKGVFFCKEANISLTLDAYEESLEAPSLSFLGKTKGFLSGAGVYGIWIVTDCTAKGNTATIRLSNDTGADAQTVRLTLQNDSTYRYKAVGGNAVRRAQGRKLVKIADEMAFRRIR